MRFLCLAVSLSLLFACSSESKKPPPQGPSCEDAFQDGDGACTRGAIAGRVRAVGAPSEHVVTVSIDGGAPVEVEADGSFRLERLTPGTHALHLEADGFAARDLEDVEVVAARTTELAPVELEPEEVPSAIRGTITRKGAATHDGTLVTLDDSTLVLMTADDGSFAFEDVEPGDHVIHARHEGFEPLDLRVTVIANEDARVSGQLQPLPAPGALMGFAYDAETDLPLEGVEVRIQGIARTTLTSSDGSYWIENVVAGTYEVRAGLEDYEPVVIPVVQIEAGATTRLNLALTLTPTTGTVGGTVRRIGGADHTGIRVVLESRTTRLEASPTGANGRWEIGEVPAGLYLITATDGVFSDVSRGGFAVRGGPNTAPELVLGPSVQIDERLVSQAVSFPKARKAIVWFESTPGLFLFDAASGSTRLVTERTDLSVIAVDPTERWATLFAAKTFHRLDLQTGVLEAISTASAERMISERSLTLFRGGDNNLYALKAGDLAPAVVSTQCRPGDLRPAVPLDQTAGWRLVSVSTGCVDNLFAVNFDTGWVSPPSETIYSEIGRSTVALVGFSSGGSRAFRWADLRTGTTSLISPDKGYDTLDSTRTKMIFEHDGQSDGTYSLSRVDLPTGVRTPLLQGVRTSILVNGFAIAAVGTGDEWRWVSTDDPATGVVCTQARTVEHHFGSFDCLSDATEPSTLVHVDYDRRTTEVWSQAAADLVEVYENRVHWVGTDGQHHARMVGMVAEAIIPCSSATFIRQFGGTYPATMRVARCADGEMYAVDFSTGAVVALGAGDETDCSIDSFAGLAICLHSCASDYCESAYDLRNGTSVPLGPVSTYSNTTWWSETGGGALLSTGGAALHVRRGSAGGPPEVTTCSGIPAYATASAVSPKMSLWTSSFTTYYCADDGSSGLLSYVSGSGVKRIGKSSRYVVGDGVLVDLETGEHERVASGFSGFTSVGNAAWVTSDMGLVRIEETGDPFWFIDDAPVVEMWLQMRQYFRVNRVGQAAILKLDAAGNMQVEVENVSLVWPGNTFELYLHDVEGTVGWATLLDRASGRFAAVPEPVAVDANAALGSDRYLFHAPNGGGLRRFWFETGEVDDLGTAASLSFEDGLGYWILNRDGWTWRETAESSEPILAAFANESKASKAGEMVFNAEAPDGSYWVDAP